VTEERANVDERGRLDRLFDDATPGTLRPGAEGMSSRDPAGPYEIGAKFGIRITMV
jgi:hypothetical protein